MRKNLRNPAVLRVLTYNVNGIRAAIRKGFLDWLDTQPADVICLQEIKAQPENLDLSIFEERGYQYYGYSAEKKGYSGVAILTRIRPQEVHYGHGYAQSDMEGRVIRARFGDLMIIGAYFPSGTSGDLRQTYKYQWLDEFQEYIDQLGQQAPYLLICGDFNIAHTEFDLHSPKTNKKTSGFLPEERAWMDRFLESGFVDSFRLFHQGPGYYTWWTQRFPRIREENKGWRLDYVQVSQNLAPAVIGAGILPQVKHSDHCPAYADIALETGEAEEKAEDLRPDLRARAGTTEE